MNEAQKKTLEKLPGFEVQTADSGPYLQIAVILPDGKVIDATKGEAAEVIGHSEGSIIVGRPA